MHICEHVCSYGGGRVRGVVGLGMRTKFKKKEKRKQIESKKKNSAKTAIFPE